MPIEGVARSILGEVEAPMITLICTVAAVWIALSVCAVGACIAAGHADRSRPQPVPVSIEEPMALRKAA